MLPGMLSAIFAMMFAGSLLPGRTPMCLAFAERISGGIMPDGAETYCRRLTWVWFAILTFNAVLSCCLVMSFGRRGAFWSSIATPAVVAATFLVEGRIRRRRFSVSFHTSGSTSQPKTIVKTFESLAKEVAFHRDWLHPSPDTVFLSTIEPDHMYGKLWRVMLPSAAGCQVDPEIILSPESLVEKMHAAWKVFFVTTPSFLKRFCAYAEQYDVPQNCVEITTSGALLDAETSAAAKRVFGVAPLEIFGSTETGGVAWRRQGGDIAPDGCDWEVFAPVKVWTSADGRLAVRSPFSFRRRFVMGDGVELSHDRRRFRLLGRRDRVVKIAEQRVSLPEMEERMKSLDGIDDAALVALDGEKGTYLGAAIVLSDGGKAGRGDAQTVLEMRRRLLPIFPKGAVPRRYRFVAELPRNAQGKVLASEIRALIAKRTGHEG